MTLRATGVVLAAGASRRMGSPKAALALGGRTFLAHVVDALRAGGVADALVVTGRDPDGAVAAAARAARVPCLRNPDPERGQLSSLKIALAHLLDASPAADAAVVALVDHPAVRPSTVAALLAAARAPGAAVVLPAHDGRRGHPVLFRRAVWRELLDAPDALGARVVVRAEPARVAVVPVDDPGVLTDVDTPDDLRRLLADRAGRPT